jgi:hypothetical protein
MLGQISGMSFPTKTRNCSYQDMPAESFGGTIPHLDLNPLGSYLWGHLKTRCIQLQFQKKRQFTKAFCMPVIPFATAQGPLKGCASAWIRALIQAEHILASVVNFDSINNNTSKILNLETCTVNVLCQLELKYYIVKVFILDVIVQLYSKYSLPDKCLYQLFVLMWRPRYWSLSKYFRYTLYTVLFTHATNL